MQRRDFIRIAGAGTAAGLLSGNLTYAAGLGKKTDLGYHRIKDISFSTIRLKYPRSVGKNSHLGVHGTGPTDNIHILTTDKGASGWGLNRGNEKILREKFELIKGKTVEEIMVPETGVTDPLISNFDFSLYDLAGQITRKPVYQLLGKRRPETQLCYSGMIYFDDLEPLDKPVGIDRILEECRWDYNYGYRQFKLKIGRGYKWMDMEKGLQRDIEVTKLVAAAFPDCDILVDGNNGFTIEVFLRYLEGIEGVKLFWIEEPFHETVDDYVKLWSWMRLKGLNTLLADGEASPDESVLRTLGSQKIISVFIQDITSLGLTKWISLMSDVKAMGIKASPHAWGSAVKTNYCAHLAGAFGNTATIEGVTCTSDDVDLTGYTLKKGKLIPSSKPGFGMELLKKF